MVLTVVRVTRLQTAWRPPRAGDSSLCTHVRNNISEAAMLKRKSVNGADAASLSTGSPEPL